MNKGSSLENYIAEYPTSVIITNDNQGYPMAIPVAIELQETLLHLQIRDLNPPKYGVKQKLQILLLSSDPTKKNKILLCKIREQFSNNQYTVEILDISEKTLVFESPLLELIQSNQSNQNLLDEYARKIYQDMIKSNDKCLLVATVAGIKKFVQAKIILVDGNKFNIQIESNDATTKFLEYISIVHLVFIDKDATSREIILECAITQITTEIQVKPTEINYHAEPLKISFGKQSILETYEFERPVKDRIKTLFKMNLNRFRYWMDFMRFNLLIIALLPLIFISYYAKGGDTFSNFLFILSIITFSLIQISINLFNDYWDHKTNRDEIRMIRGKYSKDYGFIQSGLSTILRTKVALISALLIGGILGLWINYLVKDNVILYLGLIGVAIGVIYSLPPMNLSQRWFGDLILITGFVILELIGGFYVQTNQILNIQVVVILGLIFISQTFIMFKIQQLKQILSITSTAGNREGIIDHRVLRKITEITIGLLLYYSFIIIAIKQSIIPNLSAIVILFILTDIIIREKMLDPKFSVLELHKSESYFFYSYIIQIIWLVYLLI